MDYLKAGRDAICREVFELEEIDRRQPRSDIFSSGIVDDERQTYAYVSWGWNGKNRVKALYFLVRVHNGKFWIEEDGTEEGVATHLLNAGVPNDKIVLAFRHPSMREYTEFAVA